MHVRRRLGWLGDIDRFAPVELVENLANNVGKSFAESGAGAFMVWDIYLDNLTEASMSGGNARWYVKAHRPAHSRFNSIPMQYCPVCLREPIPYFRKAWRMSFVTECLSHQTLLRSACPNPDCGSAFFYRGTLHTAKSAADNAGLRFCLACNADLSQVAATLAPNIQLLRNFQAGLVGGLDDGLANFPWLQTTTVKALHFVEHVIRLLWTIKAAPKNRQNLECISSIHVNGPAPSPRRQYFDAAEAVTRAQFLWAAAWLLEQWPTRYLQFRSGGGTTSDAARETAKKFNIP